MVNATNGSASASMAGFTFANQNTSGSTDLFAQQLATAIEGYLGKIGNGSHFEIDIQSGPGQSSGGSQFTVTVKD